MEISFSNISCCEKPLTFKNGGVLAPTARSQRIPLRCANEEVFEHKAALSCVQRTAAFSASQAPFANGWFCLDADHIALSSAGGQAYGFGLSIATQF